MPASTARAAAIYRSQLTGEHPYTARAGLKRDGSPGLDHCTDAQAQLRALLALGWFNTGLLAAPDLGWSISHTLNYGTRPSPRRDHLVLIVSAPYNVADQLVCDGVPGMRVERAIDWNTVLLRHLPTGATLEVTSLSQPKTPGPGARRRRPRERDVPHLGTPLQEPELAALKRIPPMTDDARRLLAALAVRTRLSDTEHQWQVHWYNDPLRRPRKRAWSGERRLWGHGSTWSLEWTSYPFPEDLVAALSGPRCGLAGLRARPSDTGWALTYGDAELRLHDREPPKEAALAAVIREGAHSPRTRREPRSE